MLQAPLICDPARCAPRGPTAPRPLEPPAPPARPTEAHLEQCAVGPAGYAKAAAEPLEDGEPTGG